jgi:di/tricarboxylate transporter
MLDIAIVLSLLVTAIILFATEKISVDIITLLLLIALVATGILNPAEAFEGFSSDMIVILGSIFVIGGALQETGVLDELGSRLLKMASSSTNRLLLLLMGAAGSVSAFMNNTTVTAMLLPPVIGISRRARIPSSKLLMPLAYASILGGTCTLIGTSTNVAVSGYIERAGMQPLGLFEMTPVGLIILVVGVLYMITAGERLLPERREEPLTVDYAMREYLSEIIVLPNSPLIGQTSYDSDLTILDFRILKIIRGNQEIQPDARAAIREGDTLLVQGRIDNLMKVKKIEGIEIKPETTTGGVALQTENMLVAEVLITPQSDLVGRTLKEAAFRQRFGLIVLAIYRHETSVREMIGDVMLRVGDLLLVQGTPDRIQMLQHDTGLAILGERQAPIFRKKHGLIAVGFFIAAVIVGGIGWVPLSICFLSAAVMTIVLRCISIERAYEFIDWRLLILIGGMTAFGIAMEKTGTAEFLAKSIIGLLQPFGVIAVLAGFFVLTILLTQPMSNAAAALVVLPIAISTAQQLGANERTFSIGVMLAASISFIAPFEPSCVLVYGPGKYKFMDFVKTGIGLTLVLFIVVLIVLPRFWPLY